MHVAILHRTWECNTHHFELHGCGWEKKRAGRETRQSCRNVDVFCTLSPPSLPPPPPPPPTSSLQGRVENSSISSRGYSPADDIRGSRRMEFSSNIMPHKPTGSISHLFMHRATIVAPTSGDVLFTERVSQR